MEEDSQAVNNIGVLIIKAKMLDEYTNISLYWVMKITQREIKFT